jgi:serine/threonine protein kinase
MNDVSTATPCDLSLATQREIHGPCTRFEAAWRAGQRPRIEDYLAEANERVRPALLAELLRMELEHRRRNGERPTEQDYLPRFGEQEEVVRRVLAEMPRGALPHVPGYEVLEELGRGGMGVVYKARQKGLERDVALKMILSGAHAGADEIRRFRTEAEAIAKLQHPNVVQVFEIGEHQGQPFISLELCAGGGLDSRLAGTPMPAGEAAKLVRQLAGAVQAAHEAQVVHRDLKPANVLLTADGTPKITDFGLAKKLDEQGLTRTGAVVGTASYLAPEQASGAKDVGPLADVYSLGAILYECLTGRPPFKAATMLDTLEQVVQQTPAPPRLLNPNVPEDLETVCLKCLEKEPHRRYASAEQVAEELGRYLLGEPIEARPPGWVESVSRQLNKRREVLDVRAWAYVSFLGAANTFAAHAVTFWITRSGGSGILYPVCMGVHAVLAALTLWWFVVRRRSVTPDEAHIGAIYISFVTMAFALYALAWPWEVRDVLALYPALSLLSALYVFVVGRLYWGPLYLHGLVYLLLAVLVKVTPALAPLEFAVVAGGLGVVTGIALRWPRKR